MAKKIRTSFRPGLEQLEVRCVLHGGPANLPLSSLPSLIHHLDFSSLSGSPRTVEVHLLTDIRARHSMERPTVTIFLDFDGHTELPFDPNGDGLFNVNRGETPTVTTPVFDWDGDATTFSDYELQVIDETWQRVAEDFIIFNIDVTTVDPGPAAFATGTVLRVAIGGNDDWYQALLPEDERTGASGLSFIGSFTSASPNIVYVFADNTFSTAELAETVSHETGHSFGLEHQSVWESLDSDLFIRIEEYNPGTAEKSPIMGFRAGEQSTRTTWWDGPSSRKSTDCDDWGILEIFDRDIERCPIEQNDVMKMVNGGNGFYWRDDDYGDLPGSAAWLGAVPAGVSLHLQGIVNWPRDKDFFGFSLTEPGEVTFDVRVIPFGPNLDAVVELYNAAGTLIGSWNDADLNVLAHLVLPPSTYYVAVTSPGEFGDCGQYSIGISVALPPRPASEPFPAPPGSDSTGSGGRMSFMSGDPAMFLTSFKDPSATKGGTFGDGAGIVASPGTKSSTLTFSGVVTEKVGLSSIGKDAKATAATNGLMVFLTKPAESLFDVF